MSPRKPDFFILGAPKCGTTSLASWLADHPRVYLSPVKEPGFFSTDIGNQLVKKPELYARLFEGAGPEHLAVGEASTSYLISRVAVPTIEAQIPGSRHIVMVRNPVEMAYSLHEQQIRVENETIEDFGQAWRLSPKRRAGKHVPSSCTDPILLDYQTFCLLGEQLERLFGWVPSDRVLVLVLDDVEQEPRKEYLKVLQFLGVPDDRRERFPVENIARTWRDPTLGKFTRRVARGVVWAKYVVNVLPRRSLGMVRLLERAATRRRARPALSSDLRAEMVAFFDDDIRKLETLLRRDLSAWRHLEMSPP